MLRDAQRERLLEALRQIPRAEVRPKLKEEPSPSGLQHGGGQDETPIHGASSSTGPSLQDGRLSHEALEVEPDIRQRLRQSGLTLEHTFLREWSPEEWESHFVARTL